MNIFFNLLLVRLWYSIVLPLSRVYRNTNLPIKCCIRNHTHHHHKMFYVFLSLFHLSNLYFASNLLLAVINKDNVINPGFHLEVFILRGEKKVCSRGEIMCMGDGDSEISGCFITQFISCFWNSSNHRYFTCTKYIVCPYVGCLESVQPYDMINGGIYGWIFFQTALACYISHQY